MSEMKIETDAATAAADQHAVLGLENNAKTSLHTQHPEAQWFPAAGLGLFVHWGIASAHGFMDLSWGMIANSPYDAAAEGANKLPPEDYWKLAERFQPDSYDPDKWLAAAAAAGCQYAVLTAMHHDGYTLWPTQHGDFGVQSHLGGRDLVRPFVDACRRHGLKVGLYYSPPDWLFDRHYMSFNYGSADQKRFPGRPHFDTRHQPCGAIPPRPEDHIRRGREIWLARVEELLTNYGRIDLLWFDGGGHDNGIRDRARELQPHIVINSRSCDGDYDSTECSLPSERFAGWLETCHCWQHSDLIGPWGGNSVDFWGYLDKEQYKSAAWMLETLVRLRTWGGNLLVNVGPRPDGELPDVVFERLRETAEWMRHSREAVIGTGELPESVGCNVPVTTRDNGRIWYLHAVPGFEEAIKIHDLRTPQSMRLLRTGETLPFTWNQECLTVTIPSKLRSDLVDVVAVHWDTAREEFPL
jgi:alpha-L-fucosidase